MGTAHGRPEPELGSSKKRMQPELPPMTLSYSVALLCLASPDTVATVRRVASAAGREVRSVSTVAEALASLPGAGALVAALRNEPSTFLFDEGCGDVSTLITQAKQAGCVVVVYSHTAVASPDVGRACLDAGADAVVCSAEGLQQQVALFAMDSAVEQADLTPRPMGDAAAAAGRGAADASAAAAQQPALPDGASDNSAEADYYPSLLRRAQRDEELAGLMGEQHEAVHFHRRQTTQLRSMVTSLPRPLLTTGAAAAAAGESSYARVVAISDTHAYHANMDLPPGDVLIHGGDLVGNYGRDSDIAADFASFVRWLHVVAPSYTDVVFIAGNHDTLLDPTRTCGQNDPAFAKRLAEARKLLETGLPSNVHYLENGSCEVMGGRLKIWGSPVTECRLESMGKRYYSNAFERPKAERTRVYSAIPADAYYHTRTARRAEPVGRHDIEGQHRFRGNTSTVSRFRSRS